MITLSPAQEVRAAELHRRAILVNSLAIDYPVKEDKYLEETMQGGVNALWVTVGGDDLRGTIKAVSSVLAAIRRRSDKVVQATTAAEMRQAKKDGKLAVVFGTQNGECLDSDPGLLELYYKLGYRVMGVTYSGANSLGAGCAELTREVQGLSFTGIEVVQEMNRLGILIDMSHSGDATTWDVLKLSKKPVVFTHANARALCDTTRNKPDDQIKAMADSGGVMGVTPLPRMVNSDLRKATLEGLLDHIDYIVKLVGVDHVGVGTDFTDANRRYPAPVDNASMIWRHRRPEMLGTWEEFYTVPYAKDLEDMTKLPNLTRGLVARGYPDADILKVLGVNWLRVFEQVIGV